MTAETLDLGRFRQAIEAAFPDLDVRELTHLGSGWCNHAVDVDGEWVFRFPGHDDAVRNQEREAAVLPVLAGRLPFRLPVPERRASAGEHWPRPFSGAPRLPGVGLDVLARRELATPILAASLGRCLRELHRLPLDDLPLDTLECRTVEQWRGRYRWMRRRAREEVLPDLEPVLAEEAMRRWDRLMELLDAPDLPLALLHGDLYPEHVLCDPDEEVVVGLVDWEDVLVGDPAMETSGLLDVLGEEFTEHVLRAAGVAEDAGYRERLGLYRDTLPYYPLLYGADTGDAEKAAAGRAQLEASLIR